MTEFVKQLDFNPISKAIVLPNGFMHWLAPVARVTHPNEKGLKYFDKEGKVYYQKVTKELLERTIDSFKGVPVTDGHPIDFLDTKNAAQFTKGLTSTGASSSFITDTHVWLCGTNYDESLIQGIVDKKKREISPGYFAKLLSTSDEEVKEQVDRKGNHMAFVTRGRNGSTVALNLDSEADWDYCIDNEQFDSDYVALIKRDLEYLPESFLAFDFRESVDLTPFVQKDSMKTASIVIDGQAHSFQSEDPSPIVAYFKKLMADIKKDEEADKKMGMKDAEIASANGQIDELKIEIETLKTKQTDSTGMVSKDQATSTAIAMFQVLPKILALNPAYEITADSLDDKELKRQFLILAVKDRADEFKAWNLDESTIEGAKNTGKLEALYEIKSSSVVVKTADAKPYNSLEELKTLLTSSTVVSQQKDESADNQAALMKALKEQVSAVDSNF